MGVKGSCQQGNRLRGRFRWRVQSHRDQEEESMVHAQEVHTSPKEQGRNVRERDERPASVVELARTQVISAECHGKGF